MIGGIASLASPSEVNAFASTALGCGVLGVSLYDFLGTRVDQWATLSRITSSSAATAVACR